VPQNFHCLVVNLDGSDDRWRAVSAALGRADVAFERLPAVDGRARSPEAFPDYDGVRAMRHMGRGLVGGEVGCYLSHLAAARAFLDTGAPHGLILEDDAAPSPELRRIVARTADFLDAADPAWRIVNLGNRHLKLSTPCFEIEADGATYILERAFSFPSSTVAIMWSRRGAGEFVANHDRIFAPVDFFFCHWITRAGGGYAFAPQSQPVPYDKLFQSEIDGSYDVDNVRAVGAANTEHMVSIHPYSIWFEWRRKAMETLVALHRKLTAPSLRKGGITVGKHLAGEDENGLQDK